MMDKMGKIASSPWVAIFGAGALLANPGVFIPFALKTISETDPSSSQYIVDWIFFALVSLLPLTVAILMLLVARDWAERILGLARDWLERRARVIAAVIITCSPHLSCAAASPGSRVERSMSVPLQTGRRCEWGR